MKVEIVEVSTRHFEVHLERLGLVGHIFEFGAKPFRLKWNGSVWIGMTPTEHVAVLAAVTPKVTLLNITRRLTK